MTKLTVVAALLIAAGSLTDTMAEGYQVNTLSAKQNGMGHTGVAQKLGAESMIFNPAGMAHMDRIIDFSGSVTGIFANASATLPDGSKYTTANDPSTPLSFNLGFSIYKNLKGGVSFYTPYGSGINWGTNWPGAVFSQSVKLQTFTIQPTLALRILPNLSIGAGAMMTWGTVNLDKGLVPGSSFAALLSMAGQQWIPSDTPASINLKGKANMTVGVNVGLMWDISSKVTVGASFRSQMNMKVKKGTASVSYANELSQAMLQQRLNILDEANFAASMPCAAVWNLGVAYRPTSRLLLAFDAQLTQWSAYKNLDIEFLSESLKPYDQHIAKNYRNSMTYKIGGQYSITERFDVRLGLMVDTTPVRDDHYNPETPGMTRVSPSVGFSFSPIKNFSIDAALLYVAGCGADGKSVTTTDLLTQKPAVFTANYQVSAWNPSLGVSVRF